MCWKVLVVDERAVAAAGIADPPGVVFVEDDSVDARGKRVGEDDGAIQAAADAILLAGVERKAGSRPVASRHVEILVHARLWFGWDDDFERAAVAATIGKEMCIECKHFSPGAKVGDGDQCRISQIHWKVLISIHKEVRQPSFIWRMVDQLQ